MSARGPDNHRLDSQIALVAIWISNSERTHYINRPDKSPRTIPYNRIKAFFSSIAFTLLYFFFFPFARFNCYRELSAPDCYLECRRKQGKPLLGVSDDGGNLRLILILAQV